MAMNENKMVAVRNLARGDVFRQSRTNRVSGVTRSGPWDTVTQVSRGPSHYYVIETVSGATYAVPGLSEVEVQV